jgi:hypothetical protein
MLDALLYATRFVEKFGDMSPEILDLLTAAKNTTLESYENSWKNIGCIYRNVISEKKFNQLGPLNKLRQFRRSLD